MINFDVAKQTQLRASSELSDLFGVSYVMTNKYLTGQSYPRGENREHIDVTMQVLEALLKAGKLPLEEGKSEDARIKAVAKIKDFVKSKKRTK